MGPSRAGVGMVHSSSSSGIFFQGDVQSQALGNSHLGSFGNSANSIPGNMRSNMVPVSGDISSTIMNSVASSGPSIGASSLVTDANSGLSGGGPRLQRSASANTESYMRLPASPLSFSSNNVSISGSSVIDGPSAMQQSSNQDPHSQQVQQQGPRQGASTATSLPPPRIGQVSLPNGSRVPGSFIQDNDNTSHLQKKPRLDIKQEDIMQQQVLQQILQRQDSMQLQNPNPQLQTLIQQQRLRQQQQQQQQLLQSLPPVHRAHLLQQQQQLQLRQQLQQQSLQPASAIKRPYDGGVCSRRLMQYLYHQRQRPDDNGISYWRKFVAEYYSPRAKKRWCLSLYDNVGHHSLGVFRQAAMDAWQCDICGSKSGRGFEATYEVLPRLSEIKFGSGVIDELLFLDLPREYRFPSGIMVLEYGQAVQESIYEQLRVVREGQLKVIFTPDLKILTWEFCARRHEELLPRRLVAPQVHQLLQVAQKCQSTIAESGSDGVSQQDLQTNSNMSRGMSNNLQIKRYGYPIGETRRPFQTVITSGIRDDSTKYFDFAVIGSGVAGLRYALEVAKHGTVAVITKAEPHESNTNYAQGGVSAVLCPSDSVESHMQDTIVAGAYLCDEETVRVVCTEGPERIRELIAMGASFDHGEDGNLHLAREGGHSHHRIVHAADMTGREIERALLTVVENDPNISVFKHHFAIDLLTSQDGSGMVCHGVDTMDTETRKVVRFISKVTLLASGGAGHIYPCTTNPPVATGDGIAMAHRAQAVISNMEFVQFHPTALSDEGLPIAPTKTRENAFLITEAVRGDGGLLYNLDMERFMPMYDERAELAPRDVVARSIDDQLKKRNEKYVLLDISHKARDGILSHFPNIAAECLKYGLDITRQPIPVVPAAHYMCGGVRAGLQGETNVRGLYVAGEVACTGLHGANRLASNSLLEALVFARRAVKPSIDHMKGSYVDQSVSRWWDPPVVPMQLGCNILGKIIRRTKEVRKELQAIMWEYVGIVRSTTRLKAAEQRIGELELEWEAYLFQQGWEPTMVELEACEMRNLFCCAKLVVSSALARHESRGLHYTTDFPHVNEQSRLPTIIFPCSTMNRTWSSRQLHKQQIL